MRFAAAIFLACCTLAAIRAEAAEEPCHPGADSLRSMSAGQVASLVQERFASSRFDCAIDIAGGRAVAIATIPGDAGFEARFALRELALDVLQHSKYPVESRVALLKAIVAPHRAGTPDRDEIRGDIAMLAIAHDGFTGLDRSVSEFDVTDIAIRLMMRLPPAERDDGDWGINDLAPLLKQRLPQLIALIDDVKKEPSFEAFKSSIMEAVNRCGLYFEPSSPVADALAQAAALLAVTEKVSDLPPPAQDLVPGWYWRPTMQAGIAELVVGHTDEGRRHIEGALQIIHDMQNANYRLYQYGMALSSLWRIYGDGRGVVIHYDRSRLLSLMDEMATLANSLDTPTAREARSRIAQQRARLVAEPER